MLKGIAPKQGSSKELVLPRIPHSPEDSDTSESDGLFGEEPREDLEANRSILELFKNKRSTKQLRKVYDTKPKYGGRLAAPKQMKNNFGERRSILDLHITDPSRFKTFSKEEIENEAYEQYRKKCQELMIIPVRFGLNYRGPQPKKIDAKNYLMGQDHLEAFNVALSLAPKIHTLNLRNNRLGGEPAKELLKKPIEKQKKNESASDISKMFSDDIVNLDLSENPNIPFETYQTIALMIEDSYNILQVLNLEGNKMGDRALTII